MITPSTPYWLEQSQALPGVRGGWDIDSTSQWENGKFLEEHMGPEILLLLFLENLI